MSDQKKKTEDAFEILVFKTSLQTPVEIRLLSVVLENIPGIEEWSVDPDDWEKILRITSRGITAGEVTSLLGNIGIHSRELAKGEW